MSSRRDGADEVMHTGTAIQALVPGSGPHEFGAVRGHAERPQLYRSRGSQALHSKDLEDFRL